MNWKLKCLVLHTLARVPALHSLFKRLTGRYFFQLTDAELDAYRFHVRNFRGGKALEFGAGSNLLCSLLLSQAGASEVLAYDLSRLATIEQVNDVIGQLRERGGPWPEVCDLGPDLFAKYRIRYVAPGDARATRLSNASVDFICSTSTLEHIPESEIRAILAECRRIAAPDAIMSHIIDYHDHYSSADRSITRINFYRYSDRLWRLFNPSTHYQNRLRHSDYERLFASCGLHATESRPTLPRIDIDRSRMHAKFRHYTDTDLVALNGFFVLHG
jgi:hypothetical protein